MTERPHIIAQHSPDPLTCMACGRKSTGIGVHDRPTRRVTAWTCDNPECIAATKYLAYAAPANLSLYERVACGEAAKAIADDCLRECMMAMHAAGTRDLDAVTADQIEAALEGLIVNGTLSELLKRALLSFGDSIRAQALSNAAPF